MSYILVVYPEPVVQYRYAILLEVSGGRAFYRIPPIVKDILGPTYFASGGRVAAQDNACLPGIGFNHTGFCTLQRTAGIEGEVLLIADTDDN